MRHSGGLCYDVYVTVQIASTIQCCHSRFDAIVDTIINPYGHRNKPPVVPSSTVQVVNPCICCAHEFPVFCGLFFFCD